FFQVRVLDQYADRVVLANRGAEEAELDGLADDQSELLARNLGVRALLHPERRNGEGFHRIRLSGHGGHGAFDADVVSSRYAAADTHATAAAGESVIGSTARDGMHQVFATQRL